MPITFDCPCGKSLRVGDEHAGRRVKCPACGAIVSAPKPPPQFEVVNEEEEPQFEIVEDEPRKTPRAVPAKPSTDDDDEPRPKKRKHDRDDDEESRPRKKKKRRLRAPPPPEYEDNYRGRGDSELTPLDWLLCIFCPVYRRSGPTDYGVRRGR